MAPHVGVLIFAIVTGFVTFAGFEPFAVVSGFVVFVIATGFMGAVTLEVVMTGTLAMGEASTNDGSMHCFRVGFHVFGAEQLTHFNPVSKVPLGH